jgi:hypothetical protein
MRRLGAFAFEETFVERDGPAVRDVGVADERLQEHFFRAIEELRRTERGERVN